MQSICTFPNMGSIFAFDPPNAYFVLQPWKIKYYHSHFPGEETGLEVK